MPVPPAAVPAAGALVAVVATGVPALLHQREPDVVNLATGLVLLVSGSQLSALRQTRPTGTLLVLAAVAWFLPDLAPDVDALGRVLAYGSLVHVTAVVAAVLVAPEGRVVRRVHRVALAVSAAASLSAFTGGYELAVPAAGVVLVLAVVVPDVRRWWATRPGRTYLVAVVATAMALAGVPTVRALVGTSSEAWLFAAYGGLLATASVALVRVGPWLRRATALDVGPDALMSLDDLLAEVTGDPAAHAVVRVAPDAWVRLDGRPAAPAELDDLAVVVARRPVPPALRATVDEGLRLAAQNLVTRRVVHERVTELELLRTRLVRVEDDERTELVTRLRQGPLAALVRLRADLAGGRAPDALLRRVRETEDDLTRVASGLDPLDGYASVAEALRVLAQQEGAEVRVDAGCRPGPTGGRALWFACSEALANTVKHAPSARRQVTLASDDPWVVLVVADDGPGPGRATARGLVGVRDRIAAVGGSVDVADLRPGTRVEVRVPGTRHHLDEAGAGADAAHRAPSVASTSPTEEASP
jgi:signal transduction histidine kinase